MTPVVAVLIGTAVAVQADGVDVGPRPNDPHLNVEGDSNEDGTSDDGLDEVDDSDSDDGGPTRDYRWLPSCGENYPGESIVTCPGMYTCESNDATNWTLWARELPDGEWYVAGTECYSEKPPESAPDVRPQVTDAVVLREVRRVGLPSAAVHIQPEGATLVNFDTIFYTSRPEFTETVELLGYSVDIEAEPSEYVWNHGDGSSQATTTAGAPYPAMDVLHRYSDAHLTVHPTVDVTYRVRWRVDGAAWHGIDEPLTAPGQPTALRIKEATAVLTDPYT